MNTKTNRFKWNCARAGLSAGLLLCAGGAFADEAAAEPIDPALDVPSRTIYHKGGGKSWMSPPDGYLYADAAYTQPANWEDHCWLRIFANSHVDVNPTDVWGVDFNIGYPSLGLSGCPVIGAGGFAVSNGVARLAMFKQLSVNSDSSALIVDPAANESKAHVELSAPQTWYGRPSGNANLVMARIHSTAGVFGWASIVARPSCNLTFSQGVTCYNFSPSNDFSKADLTIEAPAQFLPMRAIDRTYECYLRGRRIVLKGAGSRLELGRWYGGTMSSATEPRMHGVEVGDADHLAAEVEFADGAEIRVAGGRGLYVSAGDTPSQIIWSIPKVKVTGAPGTVSRIYGDNVALGLASPVYTLAPGTTFTFEYAPTNKLGVAAGFQIDGGGTLELPIDTETSTPSGAIAVAAGSTLVVKGAGVVSGALSGAGTIEVAATDGKSICLLRPAGFTGTIRVTSGTLIVDEPAAGGATIETSGSGAIVYSGGTIVTDVPRTGVIDVTPDAPLHVYGCGLGAECQVNLKGGTINFYGTEGVIAAPVTQLAPSYITNAMALGVARFTGTLTSELEEKSGWLVLGGNGTTIFTGDVTFPNQRDNFVIDGGRVIFRDVKVGLSGYFQVQGKTERVALEGTTEMLMSSRDNTYQTFTLYGARSDSAGGFFFDIGPEAQLKVSRYCDLALGMYSGCTQHLRVYGTLEFEGPRTSRLGNNLSGLVHIELQDGSTFINGRTFTRKGYDWGVNQGNEIVNANRGAICVSGAATWIQQGGTAGGTMAFGVTNALAVRLDDGAHLTLDLSQLTASTYETCVPWTPEAWTLEKGAAENTGWRVGDNATITVKGDGRTAAFTSFFGTNVTLRVAGAGTKVVFTDTNFVSDFKLAVAPTGEWRTGETYVSRDPTVPAPACVTFEENALWTIRLANGKPVSLTAPAIVLPDTLRFAIDPASGAETRAGVFAVSEVPMRDGTRWVWTRGGTHGPKVALEAGGQALVLRPGGLWLILN